MRVPAPLVQRKADLQRLDPLNAAEQAIPYEVEHWAKWLGSNWDLEHIATLFPSKISRGDIAILARVAQDEHSEEAGRRLFIASMIWGYGRVGYGPRRTIEMLAAPDATRVILNALGRIREGDIRVAYEEFRLRRCGPAFFTKYFYFAGLGCVLDQQPLILDSLVADALERWLGLDISALARVVRKCGTITAVGRYSEGYERYVRQLNDWAHQLGCRPDSIELMLFKWGKEN